MLILADQRRLGDHTAALPARAEKATRSGEVQHQLVHCYGAQNMVLIQALIELVVDTQIDSKLRKTNPDIGLMMLLIITLQ
jgi:hypothetical protein